MNLMRGEATGAHLVGADAEDQRMQANATADPDHNDNYADNNYADVLSAYRPPGLGAMTKLDQRRPTWNARSNNQDLKDPNRLRSHQSSDLSQDRAESTTKSQHELVNDKVMRILGHGSRH